ncbi:MAG: hypothetical protein LAP61_05655 [Acidobacteriia bacterium]|nr:hypothetical protein [Terriglobia bacterium]
MNVKFGRNYRLTIDPKDGGPQIIITLPFTTAFWVQRNNNSDLNRLDIDIYNLSEEHRNRIFQDRFNNGAVVLNGDQVGPRTIVFEAGYGTLYRIFEGDIFRASSARQGTDIITRIEARDGHYDVSATQVFQTSQSGQTLGDILKTLIGQFPNLKLGAVGNYSDSLSRPVVLNGNVYDLLKQYSENKVYIDSGKVYVLRDAEAIEGEIATINDATGILETPRRDDGFLSITTLLEAGINMMQQVKIESTVQKVYNGQYAVIGILHQGMISAAASGHCRSTFNLLAPNLFQQGNQPAFVQVPSQ